jgi:hypothetical protein
MIGKIIGGIFVAIVAIAIVYSAGYYSTNFSLEKNYYNYYNGAYSACMADNNTDLSLDADSHTRTFYRSCILQGGCYEPCGSACSDRPVKSIEFFDLVPYYLEKTSSENTACIALCVPKCFYPSSSQYFGS